MNPLKTFGGAIHAWQEEGGVGAPARPAPSGSVTERAAHGFEAFRRANLGLPPRISADARNALVRAIDERRATVLAAAPGCKFIIEGPAATATQAYVSMDAGRDIKSIFGPFAI